jgi:hypothetical protein
LTVVHWTIIGQLKARQGLGGGGEMEKGKARRYVWWKVIGRGRWGLASP